MTFHSKTLITIALTLMGFCAFSQTDNSFVRNALTSFETYSAANPIEKVYLQTDKNTYDIIDTIWYKAYTVVGPLHQPSALSGVLYTELIDINNSVVSRQVLHLSAGIGFGDFVLSGTIKQGDYRLRAYTKWMRNAGPEYFFIKKIHIGGFDATTVKQSAQAKPDVQFLPEGGEMVNGLRSKIAVKSIATNGLGQDVSGVIVDNDGNIIVDFATQHLGMGAFAFTPENGKSYKARIKTGIGETSFDLDLPMALDAGFILGLNNSRGDSLFLKVAANAAFFQQKQHTAFYVIGQSGGKIYYTAKSMLEDQQFTAAIDKKRFPSGIVQFTLFTGDGEPVNERSAFIANDDTLQLKTHNTKKVFSPGQKVTLELEVKSQSGQPVTGAFSAAVTNESILLDDNISDNSIFDALLLTSDLKGYVENPGYYFTNSNDQTRADLDILLLTQGYQRFEWKSILNNPTPQLTYSAEASLGLAGSIKTLSGKPVPHANILLIATKDHLITDTLTDDDGNFIFKSLDLPDSAKVMLNAKTIYSKNNVNITINAPNYPPIIKEKHSLINSLYSTFQEAKKPDSIQKKAQEIEDLRNRRMLREVTVKGHKYYKRKTPDLSNSDNLNGPGMADQVIMDDDLKGCVNLDDCLPGIITGVQIINGTPYNLRSMGVGGPPPMVLIIDGAVTDEIKLADINPNNIHSIEVLKSGSYLGIYGGRAGGGALVITTKRAGDKSFFISEPLTGTLKLTYNSYYMAHEFYLPKYKNLQDNAVATDLRSTIYWNPNIITDHDGKVNLDYYNGGTKGIYRVIIEGINDDGNIGRLVYRYKVE